MFEARVTPTVFAALAACAAAATLALLLVPGGDARSRPLFAGPAISITKLSGAGGLFGIRVSNTGSVTLRDVTVDDPSTPACDRKLGTMAPGTLKSYICYRTGTSHAPNIAVVAGTAPNGRRVTDQDEAEFIEHLAPAATG